MTSILNSIKTLLGAPLEDTSSNAEIIMLINDALMTLNQLGVGPEEGFVVTDDTAVWSDFVGDVKNIEGVKAYVYVCVRLIWDPPATSFVLEAFQRKKAEGEARLPLQIPTIVAEVT